MQQLAFIREWGGAFVVPIPRCHRVSLTVSCTLQNGVNR